MIKMLCSFSVGGNNFSPRLAESELGLTFQFKIEKGEKWERINRLSDHGCGIFSGFRDLEELLSIVENNITDFRRLKAADFSLDLAILHDGQCNFEFDANLINRMAQLGCPVTISTYLDEAAFGE
jgi:hypothetical protein